MSYRISLKSLFDYLKTKKDHGTNNVTTFFNYTIFHAIYGEDNTKEYYDLINPYTGEVLCMNDEECILVKTELDCFVFISEDTNEIFELIRDEFNHCCFEINENKNI